MRAAKIFYAADIHGSETCFRKFLNAGKFYTADVLILGGDLGGKLIVPMVRNQDGSVEITVFGQRHYGRNPGELAHVKGDLATAGVYIQLTDRAEYLAAANDPERQRQLFRAAMRAALEGWVQLAEQRLRDSSVECYIMPGNDDDPIVGDILKESTRFINPDMRVLTIAGRYEMLSVGYSNRTPFHSPREMDEAQLESSIRGMAESVQSPELSIFNTHCPPYDSGLDLAPQVDEELRIQSFGGQPRLIPVGSTAVRKTIEEYQPLISLHGHVHESRGITKLGRTMCFNPGSEYGEGILHGILLELDGSRLVNYQFVSG